MTFDAFLCYDESSPSCLRWKVDCRTGLNGRICKVSSGSVAGCLDTKGYWVVQVCGKIYKAHRIVMSLHGVNCRKLDIDHIDRNRSNNNIKNLRAVDRKINRRNISKSKANKTGITGVIFRTYTNKNGDLREYYISTWVDAEGKTRCKSFPIFKLGKDLAFKLACECRMSMIAELNSEGAGYSSTHGE